MRISYVVFRTLSLVFGNIGASKVFRMLGDIVFFLLRIVLALIFGYWTECRTMRMCMRFMSYFAHRRWSFGTICTIEVFRMLGVIVLSFLRIFWRLREYCNYVQVVFGAEEFSVA